MTLTPLSDSFIPAVRNQVFSFCATWSSKTCCFYFFLLFLFHPETNKNKLYFESVKGIVNNMLICLCVENLPLFNNFLDDEIREEWKCKNWFLMAEVFFKKIIEKNKTEFWWVTEKIKLAGWLVGTIVVKYILMIKLNLPMKLLNPNVPRTYCSLAFGFLASNTGSLCFFSFKILFTYMYSNLNLCFYELCEMLITSHLLCHLTCH